ncbi:MAG: hypothetical protein COA99_12840 [Moraxellaceae bacterium]|nr:MAG: hypothetical protein COA99_12840 [Moraxellaceae bacterium]
MRKNNTGLPDNLKSGIENISGYSMDDVRVHYNSTKPAQLQANAYTQGTNIHLGPGQEKHLAHEAWHVVQQKQGRVNASNPFKGVGDAEEVIQVSHSGKVDAEFSRRIDAQSVTIVNNEQLEIEAASKAKALA